jgi:hypothetical protein
MKKTISAVIATLAILGCSPEEAKGPSLVITDSNAKALVTNSLALTDFAEDYGDIGFRSLQDTGARNATRATESFTFSCDSGSQTMTFSVDDSAISGDDLAANGSMSITTDFNNCVEFGETANGSMAITFGWTGYDGYDASTVSLVIDFDEFETSSSEGSASMDGKLNASISGDSVSMSFNYLVSTTETGGETIRIKTTSNIVFNTADAYPSSGAWRIEGAEDTFITATIVANGVEYSVNGGQTVLVAWDDY